MDTISYDIDQILDEAYEYFEENSNGTIDVLVQGVEQYPDINKLDLIAMYFAYQDLIPQEGYDPATIICDVKKTYPEWTATSLSPYYKYEGSTLLQQVIDIGEIELLDVLADTGCDMEFRYYGKDISITEYTLMCVIDDKYFNIVRKLVELGAPKPRLSFLHMYVNESDYDLLESMHDLDTFYRFEI